MQGIPPSAGINSKPRLRVASSRFQKKEPVVNLLPGVSHPLPTQTGKQIKPHPLRLLVPYDQKGWQEYLGSLWSEVLELREGQVELKFVEQSQ